MCVCVCVHHAIAVPAVEGTVCVSLCAHGAGTTV